MPGDPSSAAFFVVAATITPGSELVIEDVSLNPGRIGFLDVLREMGADITVVTRGERLGEPVGDLTVRAAPLRGAVVDCTEAIIDEIPALVVAGAFADGTTDVRGAAELRVKESDRIATLEQELSQLGVAVETRSDGLTVHGGAPDPATLKSHGDHRIAMAAAVAANAVAGRVDGAGLRSDRELVSRVCGSAGVGHVSDRQRRRDRRAVGLGEVDGRSCRRGRPRSRRSSTPVRCTGPSRWPRSSGRSTCLDEDAVAGVARATAIELGDASPARRP